MVTVRGVDRSACCCLKGVRAVHSKIICFSSPTPPLLQAKQTLLALPTWPAPAKRPIAMTAQPKLQKSLHAPPRNRKLTMPPAWAIRLNTAHMCMKQHPEWWLHEDNTDRQNLYRFCTCTRQACGIKASTTPSTSNRGTTSCTQGISRAGHLLLVMNINSKHLNTTLTCY